MRLPFCLLSAVVLARQWASFAPTDYHTQIEGRSVWECSHTHMAILVANILPFSNLSCAPTSPLPRERGYPPSQLQGLHGTSLSGCHLRCSTWSCRLAVPTAFARNQHSPTSTLSFRHLRCMEHSFYMPVSAIRRLFSQLLAVPLETNLTADSYAALAALPLSYPWSCLVLDLKELLPILDRYVLSCIIASHATLYTDLTHDQTLFPLLRA